MKMPSAVWRVELYYLREYFTLLGKKYIAERDRERDTQWSRRFGP